MSHYKNASTLRHIIYCKQVHSNKCWN